MPITGEMLIGRKAVRGEEKPLRAFNPATGSEIAEPVFGSGTVENVEQACALAQQAFDAYRKLPLAVRAEFLDRIADSTQDDEVDHLRIFTEGIG